MISHKLAIKAPKNLMFQGNGAKSVVNQQEKSHIYNALNVINMCVDHRIENVLCLNCIN